MASEGVDMPMETLQKGNALFGIGGYMATPQKVFQILISWYCIVFAVHRLVDFCYYCIVDGRFPEGLNGYSSVYERLQTVSYIKQMLTVSMLSSTLTFCVVLALVCTDALERADVALRNVLAYLADLWEMVPSCLKCPFRCMCGCCSCLYRWSCKCCFCGDEPRWNDIFHGAVYLTLAGAFFSILSAPFKIWMYDINVNFGFANVLTVSPAHYRADLISDFKSSLFTGIPSFMLYLSVLRCRFGWLLMWIGLICLTTLAQYNVGALAGMLFDASTLFPDADFGVANDFPLVGARHNVSLNRIYYATDTSGVYSTKDLSKGDLELVSSSTQVGISSKWMLREANSSMLRKYAETEGSIKVTSQTHMLRALSSQPWSIEAADGYAPTAQITIRHGKALRDALLDFAQAHGIHISEVYMIDGSYKDVRANAFAAGAGTSRIIGLYDTLFLGDSSPMDNPETDPSKLFSVHYLSKKLRGVEASSRQMRRSKPTKAMADEEILAIMGHELGHSALHHAEQGMVTQAFTSFWTFALLGAMVHFPASFGVAPLAHIAVFMYHHVAAPALDSVIDLLNDGISRRNEYAADAYSARVSEGYATGLQTALAKLTVNSNADPNEPWFYELFHDDHPTTAKRWARVEKIRKQRYDVQSPSALANDGSDDSALISHVGGNAIKRLRPARRG